MKFKKAFIEDQFRGFETAQDGGNNIFAVRVVQGDEIIASWKIRDSRHLDAIVAAAIHTAIQAGIVPAGTV